MVDFCLFVYSKTKNQDFHILCLLKVRQIYKLFPVSEEFTTC